MAHVEFPPPSCNRGAGFWLRPVNLWASRSIFRIDGSNLWRGAYVGTVNPGRDRSLPFSALRAAPAERRRHRPLPGHAAAPDLRFLILADTGEGDQSQYGLLPLIRFMDAEFMLIAGDVANPAGRLRDFEEGFFRPYTGLGVPIWAVPGNHDYYSTNAGREFFDVFCTRSLAARWERAGLRLVPQPGTYWELKQPEAGLRLAVIALDTGQSGDLDGRSVSTRGGPDTAQHEWLDRRLTEADGEGLAAIVLFHIPALANAKAPRRTSGVNLQGLHQVLLRHACVRLIVCGHDHNFQRYAPDVFAAFASQSQRVTWPPACRPHYVIAGGGGSGLHSTAFSGPFPVAQPDGLFPTAQQWRDHTTLGRVTAARIGLGRGAVGTLLRKIKRDVACDDDSARYLCFLVVDVVADPPPGSSGVTVTPVWLEDVEQLFPGPCSVNVGDPGAIPCAAEVLRCLKTPIRF